MVRSGAKVASVEAAVVLPEMGVSASAAVHSHEVVFRRDIERNGRGAAMIDGRAVTVKALKESAGHLFELLGPNQQFTLLEPREQLLLVDAHAGTDSLREEFASLAEEVRDVRRRLSTASIDDREMARRRDRLAYELAEIREAELVEGEDDELAEEDARLANMDRLRSAAGAAGDSLGGSDRETPSGSDLIGEALRELREAATLDKQLDPIVAALESALYQVEDALRELDSYRDSLEYDADRHEQVQSR